MLSSAAGFLSLWVLITPTLAVVHEQLAAVPSGWVATGNIPADSMLTLQIALTQQNVAEFEEKLLAVSTPGSSSYGQFMDGNDVSALLRPSSESNDAVLTWLKDAGIPESNIVSDGEWVNFATTVENMNQILNTTFQQFENNGVTRLRTTQYSVPDEVSAHIDFIWPTISFMKTTANAALPAVFTQKHEAEPVGRRQDPSCPDFITPSVLKNIYNITYTTDNCSGSSIGFGSFLGQSPKDTDLSGFEAAQNISQQSFLIELINNGTNDQDFDGNHGEANLDVQYIIGISNPLPVTGYITGGSPPFVPNLVEPTAADNENEPYLEYYQYLLAKNNSELPFVISNSYGDDEQTVPFNYAVRVCNMIGQLGLRGISVLESAGDTGVGAACLSNDGLSTPQFTPQFPGTCPFVTTVGGTQAICPEVAWDGGSGGFSNYFPQPSYQQLAVSTYLTTQIDPGTLTYYTTNNYTNVSMRGFPDVAAHSASPEYIVVVDNATAQTGGTSAAAPTFAGVIALLNDARFKAGKGSLGFLNPWLYSTGFMGLTDIVGGGSVGCNGVNFQTGATIDGAGVIPFASWNATVGWDPVTGLGVPDFGLLVELALAL